ncbi:MAG: hypothetical protein ACR2MD_01870 [Aridibacter sp.]
MNFLADTLTVTLLIFSINFAITGDPGLRFLAFCYVAAFIITAIISTLPQKEK